MEALTRLETLRQLILEGNDQLRFFGGVAIQKAVYLVQAVFKVDLGYPYGLHHLGPYSPELTEDLQLGEQVGLWLSLDSEAETAGGGRRYEVSLAEWPEDVAEDVSRRWREVEGPLREAFGAFKSLGIDATRPFELVATIHYLRHVQSVPAADVPDTLRLLKPKYSASDIQSGEELLSRLESAAIKAELPEPVVPIKELHLKLVPPMAPEPMDVKPEIAVKARSQARPTARNLSLFEGL